MPRLHDLTEDRLNDLIDRWHNDAGASTDICEHLGCSKDDYANWVEQGQCLVVIDYTNYRGERSLRRVRPKAIRFGSTEHHPVLQYLLDAWDYDKDAERTFAMRDIHSWSPINIQAQAIQDMTDAVR